MTNRAFLVLGPESSGTRLMTSLLIAAGCYGDDGHYQRLDEPAALAACDRPPGRQPLIVLRRSLPHGNDHGWPDVAGLVNTLLAIGYDVTAVVMSRDWHAMAISQEIHHTGGDVELALASIRLAYPAIFCGLAAVEGAYELVNYEALTQRPWGTVKYLFGRLGLPMPDRLPDIYDGNKRYYPEENLTRTTVKRNGRVLESTIHEVKQRGA